MRIIGIDYSMRSPGIVIFDSADQPFSFDLCECHYLTTVPKYARKFTKVNVIGHLQSKWSHPMERYLNLANFTMQFMNPTPDLVVLEGYALGSKSGLVFNIAENTALLKWKMWERGINVEIVPPTALKKWATGKGNADKDRMHDAFQKETGVNLWKIMTPDKKNVESPTADIVDAWALCKWGWNEKMAKNQ